MWLWQQGSPDLPPDTTQEPRVNNRPPIIAVASALFLCGWGTVSPDAAQAQDELPADASGPYVAQAGMPYDPDTDEALFLLVTVNGRDIGCWAYRGVFPVT